MRMYCGECGIEFQVPDHFYRERLQTGKGWHCPNGHSRAFKESEADRFRRERDVARQQLARVEQERASAEATVRKLKKRAAAGTCPCCQRTFSNMGLHMRKQHPEFVANNVVKLKAERT